MEIDYYLFSGWGREEEMSSLKAQSLQYAGSKDVR
jgi:hypothetical protein